MGHTGALNAISICAPLKTLQIYPEIGNGPAILAPLYNLVYKNTNPRSNPKPPPFGIVAAENYERVEGLIAEGGS